MRIALFEFTCPVERNIHTANTYKRAKYSGIQGDLEDKGWKVHLVPYEVSSRKALEKHKISNHCHSQTFQDQNKSGATYVQSVEQNCISIHIFNLSRLSNQGVTTFPQTLIDPGTGLQLEMVYHATTLSGL